MPKLPFRLPRLSLRLRLSISITAIVALFTLTNITYQISSQNRNLRLDNLQKAVQGQLASVTTRQTLQNQQKEILVLDALKQSGQETLSQNEIDNGIANLQEIATQIRLLGAYAYADSLAAYNDLATSHAELDMLWQQFYTRYNSDQTPLASSIEQAYDNTIALLGEFESLEIQAAEKLTERLQQVSRFNDRVTLGIYLFTIALTVGLGYLLIRYTTQSLQNLNVGTVRIGRGDLDYHIPVKSDDEIGDLTIAFNAMSDKLRNAMVQVQQSKENADQANRAKTNFLANMSHELRTPLNAIIGYSEMIIVEYGEESKLDEQQVVDDLQHILSSGRHLLQLINDVLDLAKIESGNMSVLNETFDSVKIIKNLVTTMLPLAKKNNNKLVVEASGDIPPVYSDAVKFRQIFINLISNACKFTHDGKITLLITAKPDTQQVIYHVSDTGIGMSAEAMHHIFEAFVQAESSTAHKYGGTGLGLAICKQFIEMMHGSLDLTSAEGAGTTFTVILPITLRPERSAEAIPSANQQELGLASLPPASRTNSSPDNKDEGPASASTSTQQPGPAALANAQPRTSVKPLFVVAATEAQDLASELSKQVDGLQYCQTGEQLNTSLQQETYDFLCSSLPLPLATDATQPESFAEYWAQLKQFTDLAQQHQLPALIICGDGQQLQTVGGQPIDSFDYANRSRLTIPVRQLNPVSRRGNAVLAGFAASAENNHQAAVGLAEELAKEAWHCEVLPALESGHEASALAGYNPDLLLVNVDLPNAQAYTLLQSIAEFAASCIEQSEPVPGIYMVPGHYPGGCNLDLTAIELRLLQPALVATA
ncbi:MAG: HAMP domain-containing histidine kinase [Pseudomonadales bacterium]|nr:HAMP domain-containing histidine kinase [Pseudomonadales bacterium]